MRKLKNGLVIRLVLLVKCLVGCVVLGLVGLLVDGKIKVMYELGLLLVIELFRVVFELHLE